LNRLVWGDVDLPILANFYKDRDNDEVLNTVLRRPLISLDFERDFYYFGLFPGNL
jgi:hypothetical protein